MRGPHIFRRIQSPKARLAAAWITICLALGVCASFLANDLPIYVRYQGESYWPMLFPQQQAITGGQAGTLAQTDWKNLHDAFAVWPLVTYSPASTDLQNTGFVSPAGPQQFQNAEGSVVNMPLRYRHWLGTTETGNDVLSGLLHGASISLGIGLFSMLIAGLLGITLGAFSGFAGDKGYRMQRSVFWMILLGILPAWFYAFTLRSGDLYAAFAEGIFPLLASLTLSLFIFGCILSVFYFLGRMVGRIKFLSRHDFVPADIFLSRLTEIFSTLPRLVLIVTLSALTRPSLMNLVLIFGLTGWTDIARLVRAEMLKIRRSDYMQVAIGQGLPVRRLVLRHALPNAIQPALASMVLGISGIILAESSLSFLGIGVPFDTVTWGSLIASGKENFDAWWVVVFPGLAIFLTIASLNVLSDELRRST